MKSTSAAKIKKNISLPPGLWQLFTYGRLTSLPTAKQAIWIKAAFRRVGLGQNKEISEWTNEVIWREVPVGELVAWEVGSIFDATTFKVGKPQPIAPQIAIQELRVAFTDENCRLIRRYERDVDGNYLFYNPRLLPEDSEANTYLLQVKRETGAPLLIPCTTVLQSFWGRSSNLVHMLLDSRFLDFDRYVINTSKSSLNKSTRQACLWLRQWSLDADARFLATLAFNEEAIARGQEISKALQAAMAADGGKPHRCIGALPPHNDLVTLKVWGYELKTREGPFFYVQRLIQTSYTPPFSQLTFDRDNDGRPPKVTPPHNNGSGPDPREPIKREQRSRPRNEGASEFELGQDHPNYESTLDTTDIGRFDSVYPGISELPTEKLEQLEPKFENVAEAEVARKKRWDKLSTLPGVRQSSADAIGTTLASGQVLNDPIDTSTKPAGPPLGQLLAQVIGLAPFNSDSLRPPGVAYIDIQPVFPWRQSPAHGGQWLFSLPAEYCDFPWAWLYSDPWQLERKRGLCLRVTYFDDADAVIGAGYIVDVEGRFVKTRQKKPVPTPGTPQRVEADSEHPKGSLNAPVIYIWRQSGDHPEGADQGTLINNDDLQHLIIELLQEGGTSAREAAALKGIFCKPRRHRTDEVHLVKLLPELLEHLNDSGR